MTGGFKSRLQMLTCRSVKTLNPKLLSMGHSPIVPLGECFVNEKKKCNVSTIYHSETSTIVSHCLLPLARNHDLVV